MTELHAKAGKMIAAQFLRNLIKVVPYALHTVLTDNGIQFANRACDRYAGDHILAASALNMALDIASPRLSIPGLMARLSE